MKQEYGRFISVEGPDGGGKSSSVPLIVEHLKEKGYNVLQTREIGGTPIGEKIREAILNGEMLPMTELLLCYAARAQHVESVIRPALAQNKIVVSDRFSDSTFAYQGARGFSKEVTELDQFVLRGFQPDYTLFFDLTLKESLNRVGYRGQSMDRFEQETIAYRERVYDTYHKLLIDNPKRMHRINAMLPMADVQQNVLAWVDQYF